MDLILRACPVKKLLTGPMRPLVRELLPTKRLVTRPQPDLLERSEHSGSEYDAAQLRAAITFAL